MTSTVKAKVSAGVGMGSALMLTASQLVASGTTLSIPYNFASNSSSTAFNSSKIQQSALTIGAAIHHTWGAEANIRFKELARKEMMNNMTAVEWAELDSLAALRRQAKFPLSADQILWQRKQSALTQKLLEALKEYVDFHNTPPS